MADRKPAWILDLQAFSGRTTYLPTDEGWLYLAAVLDLHSRQIVGWSLQPHMQSTLVKDALLIDYCLGRWDALMRYLDDGRLPIDNNHIENRIRPIALGRSNWLFARSLRGGQRAAAAMSLIQTAKLNGHDPHRYLSDILERLPTHPAHRIDELLPHHWKPRDSGL